MWAWSSVKILLVSHGFLHTLTHWGSTLVLKPRIWGKLWPHHGSLPISQDHQVHCCPPPNPSSAPWTAPWAAAVSQSLHAGASQEPEGTPEAGVFQCPESSSAACRPDTWEALLTFPVDAAPQSQLPLHLCATADSCCQWLVAEVWDEEWFIKLVVLEQFIGWLQNGVKDKTLNHLMAHFYWPDICSDVCQWCEACRKCQLVNPPATPKAPLHPLPLIEVIFKRIVLDLVGPLERCMQCLCMQCLCRLFMQHDIQKQWLCATRIVVEIFHVISDDCERNPDWAGYYVYVMDTSQAWRFAGD